MLNTRERQNRSWQNESWRLRDMLAYLQQSQGSRKIAACSDLQKGELQQVANHLICYRRKVFGY